MLAAVNEMGGWEVLRVRVGRMRFGSYKFWWEQCQQLPVIGVRSMYLGDLPSVFIRSLY